MGPELPREWPEQWENLAEQVFSKQWKIKAIPKPGEKKKKKFSFVCSLLVVNKSFQNVTYAEIKQSGHSWGDTVDLLWSVIFLTPWGQMRTPFSLCQMKWRLTVLCDDVDRSQGIHRIGSQENMKRQWSWGEQKLHSQVQSVPCSLLQTAYYQILISWDSVRGLGWKW